MDLDEERRAGAASGKDPQLPISGSLLQPRVGHSLAEFEKTQEVLDALPIPIVLIDSEGIICSVNGPWRRLAAENGMAEPESWIGVNYLSICELASGDSSQGAKSAADGIRRVLRGEVPSFSLDYPCDSATERRWFRLTASPQTGELSGAIVMHLDITDCKRAELSLQETHEQNLLLLNSTAEGIFGLDLQGCCTFANAASARLLGYRNADEMLGRNLHEQHHHSRADGSPYPVTECNLYRAFLAGEDVHCTDEVFFRTSGESFPVEYWSYTIRRGSELTGAVVTFLDITERRELEMKFLRSQKLEAIGQLTGGVAHDFNNLLTVMMGNGDLLVERLATGAPDLQRLASMIAETARKGAALTQRLLAFGRRQPLDPKVVDMNVLVEGMEHLLRRTLGEQIRIEILADASLWQASVDPGQLENALLNLALNARDAMPAGGRITIETNNIVIDEQFVERHFEVSPGEYVQVSVTDSGEGIPPENLPRVFEPFFTTKKNKGTGLGLSMIYGFVKQSGGHVSIYSELGHGTRVKMFLPRDTSDMSLPVDVSGEAEIIGGSEPVLIVEDDDMVRLYASSQLRSLGYKVVEAQDGDQALEILSRKKDILLLFTDVVMPGPLNGRLLADEARKISPAIRVLFTSGYSEDAIVHHGRLDPGVNLLTKPYSRAELARKVRLALYGAASGESL